MRLKAYSALTHQGPYLQLNEDGYDFDFENDLYMVLDGFGGSGRGDRCVEKLKNEIKTFYTQISHDPNATMPLFYNPKNLLEANAILNSMLNAHQNLFKENSAKPFNHRAGASAMVGVRADTILILASVGNCSAFHFRQGRMTKVMVEDTFASLARDTSNLKFQNFPMSGFGLYPDLGFQLREIRLNEGDRVLFLTDGVSTLVSEEEIFYQLNKSAPDGKERLNSLLKLSNARGNLDNQTGMLLEF